MQKRFGLIIVCIILVAALLRVAGMFDDFWLDEVWSQVLTMKYVHRPADILTAPDMRIDNNHPLNTLFLWLIGDRRYWWVYRIPCVVAGIGSVVMTAVIALRRGRLEAILATLLVGLSYPLILYSSEARGYGLVVFFALLALDALERHLARPSWRLAVYFWAACALGLLSHLTFVHFFAGAVAWTVYRYARGRDVTLGELLRLHLVPLACCAWLYVVFVRNMIVGGWAPEAFVDALAGAVAALAAMRVSPNADMLTALVALAVLVWVCRRLARGGSDFWVFIVVGLIVSPLAMIVRQYIVLPPEKQAPILPRYFLVVLPMAMLAAGAVLADVLRHRRGRWVAVTGIVIFLATQLTETARFLHDGRGHYSDAVVYMARQTPPDQPVTVISDHFLRTQMLLNFYSSRLVPDRKMVSYDGTGRLATVFDQGPPLWAVRHFNLRNSPPAPAYSVLGTRYVLDREFTYYGLSGYSWYLYRRSD